MALEAAALYSDDNTYQTIADQLGVSKSYSQVLVRKGIRLFKERGETSSNVDEAIIPAEGDALQGNSILTFEQPEVEEIMGRTFLEQSLPIMRKVMMSPKIYLLYDYCRNKMDFKGDIGDFIGDCVDYFFASNGFEISITHKTEILT